MKSNSLMVEFNPLMVAQWFEDNFIATSLLLLHYTYFILISFLYGAEA